MGESCEQLYKAALFIVFILFILFMDVVIALVYYIDEHTCAFVRVCGCICVMCVGSATCVHLCLC